MHSFRRSRRPSAGVGRPIMLLAAAVAATFIPIPDALAINDSYTGLDGGNWNTATNWTTTSATHVVPVNGDTAILGNPAAIFSANFNGNYTGAGLANLTIDALVVPSFTLNQTTANNMIAANETLGLTQYGAIYNQTAGNNTVTNTLSLGTSGAAQSEGTYQLSGTGNLTAGAEVVGGSGANINSISSQILQSGGTNAVSTTLKVADAVGTLGLYTLSNTGTLTLGGSESIGTNGTGTFTQTGGTNSLAISSFFYLASGSGLSGGSGNGTYNLSSATGAAVLSASYEALGDNGTANFNQSGGTNTVGTILYLATNGGTATYTLTNGTLSSNTIDVGNIGNGTFIQNGGNVTVPQQVNIAALSSATASYSMSNGSLTVGTAAVTGNLRVGYNGNGTFTQNGGSVSVAGPVAVPGVFVVAFAGGNSANYSLNGNSTLNAGQEQIGLGGTGNFTQSNGTNTATANLTLGVNPSSIGNYTMSNGNLGVGNASAGLLMVGSQGSGTFVQSGGGVNAYSLLLGSLNGSFGTYTLSGANSTLSVSSFEIIGNGGASNFIQNGGTHTSSGDMTVSLGLNNNASYNLNNGTLNELTNITLGQFGTGTFNQNNGNLGVGSNLFIGYQSNGAGNYNIANGNATIGSIYDGVYGTGSVTQTGGNLTVVGTLYLSSQAGVGSGTYTLSNGSLTTTTLYQGNGGTGTFNQSGGNLTVTSAFLVGSGSSATTTYTLSNGTANVYYLYVGNFSTAGVVNQSGGSMTVNTLIVGGSSTNGTYNQSGGNLTVTSGLSLFSGAYTITAGTLNLPSTGLTYATAAGTSFNQNGGTINGYLNSNGNFTYKAGTFNGTFENGVQGVANFTVFTSVGGSIKNHGVLNISSQVGAGAGQVFSNDGTINILPGGQIFSIAPITNNGTINAIGAIGGNAGFTNNLAVVQGAGTLSFTVTGGASNNGSFTLASGRLFTLSSTLSNAGTFAVGGALINGTGTLANVAGGVVTGPGTIASGFSNAGTLLPGSGSLNISSAWTNSGVAELSGLASAITGAAITNTGTLQGFGTIGSPVANTTGTIEAIGGTLVLAGSTTNAAGGTLTVSTGNKLLVASGLAFNAGLINLTGGTFDNGGQPLNSIGQISGYGTFRFGGLTNNANITFSGTNGSTTTITGNVTNTANSSINIKFNPAIFTGTVTNNANATIATLNTTVTFAGTFNNNGFYIPDPTITVVNILNNHGTMTGGVSDGYVVTATGQFNNFGTFTNSGTFASAATVTNSGNFTQSGPQNWSSNTTFTSSGTATFNSDTGSASASPLNILITGGTVNLAATQHLNTLTINAGRAAITAGTTKTNGLSLAGSTGNWTSDLEIGSNKLVVEATAGTKAATLATLQDQVFYGTSNSNGITSATLPARTAIAVIDNAQLATPFTTFGGVSVDMNSILVAPELLGDANVDGHVDLSDLNIVLNNLGSAQTDWTHGNFDGLPAIDLNDLNAVLNNLGSTFANSSAAIAAEALLQASPSNVPEPASLAMMATLSTLLLVRRKRTN